MNERVKAMPAMNVRSREEWARIEEQRQDPDEAKTKMRAQMKDLASDFRARKAAMEEKMGARNPVSFRTKEQTARIEEARQDPTEAKAAMAQHLRQLNRTFGEEQAAMYE